MCDQTIDGQNVRGPTAHPDHDQELYQSNVQEGEAGGFTWPRHSAVDVVNMVRNFFGRVEEIFDDAFNHDGVENMERNDAEAEEEWNEANFEYLVRESTKTVFQGSTQN